MNATEVVNFYDVVKLWNVRAEAWTTPGIVYIGRENKAYHLHASPFANPFKIERQKGETEAAARVRVLQQYREHLERRPDLMAQLWKLRGKKLVCWCKPSACHGDVLIELLGEMKPDLPKMSPTMASMALDLMEEAAPDVAQQVGLDGTKKKKEPVLAWDKGGAAFESAKDKNGWYYRTNVRTQHPIGLPGKVYATWGEWRHDALKLALRVKGCAVCSGMSQTDYARYRYETRLQSMVGIEGDELMNVECLILQELLAEVMDGDGT